MQTNIPKSGNSPATENIKPTAATAATSEPTNSLTSPAGSVRPFGRSGAGFEKPGPGLAPNAVPGARSSARRLLAHATRAPERLTIARASTLIVKTVAKSNNPAHANARSVAVFTEVNSSAMAAGI